MNIFKCAFARLSALLFTTLSANALAAGMSDCRMNGGVSGQGGSFVIVSPVDKIEVDPVLPDGAVIWEGAVTVAPALGHTTFVCDAPQSVPIYYHFEQEAGSVGIAGPHPTSVPGIYVQFRYGSASGEPLPKVMNPYGTETSFTVPSSEIYMVLTKRGVIDVSASDRIKISFGLMGTLGHKGYMDTPLAKYIIVDMVAPSCTPSITNSTVSLGNLTLQDFVGGRSPAVDFQVDLHSCSGMSNSVFIGLTDANSPENVSSVATLLGSAEGVGLEVNYRGAPVSFGSELKNPNKWQVGTTDDEAIAIPLSANLLRTESQVKGGAFEGKVTYTLTYE